MMRILLIDIDSLRPDHLGCGGYHRNTSPTIDRLALQGAQLQHCFASDVPCCPSRSALFSGRYGFQTGCVNHTGTCATPWEDPARGFIDRRDRETLPARLRDNGYRTAFISAFPTRHSAWHALAGFNEWHDTGEKGHELATSVGPVAEAWLERHAHEADWFCHVTFWDVHTPYRTPEAYGDPLAGDPAPAWPDATTLAEHAAQPGLRSARDSAWSKSQVGPRQPAEVKERADYTTLINGYDTAIRFVDDHIQRLLERLEQHGVRDDTVIIITADHGEDFGEFGAYGSHCFCGPAVARVPMIIGGPGIPAGKLTGLHQHFDLSATLLELADISIPESWDAQSFVPALQDDPAAGRDQVVSSMLAQGLQRAVYWQSQPGDVPWGYVRTWDDLAHQLPLEVVITPDDPHGQKPQAEHAVLVHGRDRLERWMVDQASASRHPDPLSVVMSQGTDATAMVSSETYAKRLAETGRKLPQQEPTP